MKKIIGISGRLGCGKTIISEYLSDKLNFKIYENSSVLKEEAKKRGIEIVRENLINIAKEWQELYGEQIIAEKLLDFIDGNGIVCGIRLYEQANYLKNHSNFILIYVESSDDVILDRIIERNRYGDPINKEEFEKILKKDWNKDLEKLKQNSDFVIKNDGNLEELYSNLDKLLLNFI